MVVIMIWAQPAQYSTTRYDVLGESFGGILFRCFWSYSWAPDKTHWRSR